MVKRSVRAAVVMPSVFALAHGLFSNPQVALFGAFGSFALLLLVEFTGAPADAPGLLRGPLRRRQLFHRARDGRLDPQGGRRRGHGAGGLRRPLRRHRRSPGGDGLDRGVADRSSSRSSVAAPASAVGPRLVGWTLAAAFSITACLVVWPAPWHDNLRRRLAAAISAVARLADTRAPGHVRSRGARGRHVRVGALAQPVLRDALPADGSRVGRGGALQARGPRRVGGGQHRHGRGRALVDGAARGAGGHRRGRGHAPPDGEPDL